MSDLWWRELGGSGETLVVVHGYTGSSDDFAHVAGPLTSDHRVVLVDQLGHGRSPRRDVYSLRLLSDALIDFLEALPATAGTGSAGRVHLLGHSMGGRTVLPIAVERPDLVRSLILMDTWADQPERDPWGQALYELLDQPDGDAIDALATFEGPPSPEGDLIAERWGESWVAAHDAYNSQVDPLAVVQLGREVFGSSVSLLRDATRVGCPTTVLRGEHDRAFVGPSDRLVSHIPAARLVIIEGAYHSPQLTHPDEWVAAIRTHLVWAGGIRIGRRTP